jgi:hypothetical protein
MAHQAGHAEALGFGGLRQRETGTVKERYVFLRCRKPMKRSLHSA